MGPPFGLFNQPDLTLFRSSLNAASIVETKIKVINNVLISSDFSNCLVNLVNARVLQRVQPAMQVLATSGILVYLNLMLCESLCML